MKRITAIQKKIADAHLLASKDNSFTNPGIHSLLEMREALVLGDTFKELFDQIEIRYASITSIVLNTTLKYESKSYKAAIYRGFKTILTQQNIL